MTSTQARITSDRRRRRMCRYSSPPAVRSCSRALIAVVAPVDPGKVVKCMLRRAEQHDVGPGGVRVTSLEVPPATCRLPSREHEDNVSVPDLMQVSSGGFTRLRDRRTANLAGRRRGSHNQGVDAMRSVTSGRNRVTSSEAKDRRDERPVGLDLRRRDCHQTVRTRRRPHGAPGRSVAVRCQRVGRRTPCPPNEAAWCRYATAWVTVKVTWSLTPTTRERDALGQMLDRC